MISDRNGDRLFEELGWEKVVLLVANLGIGFAQVGDVKEVKNRRLEWTKWNAFSRIEVQRVPKRPPILTIDALARTDMTTLLGPVKFVAYNQKSQQNQLPTFLVQWINGKQEIIWPSEFATHPPVYPAPQ